MQFSTAFLTSLLAATALATPVPEPATKSMATAETWTIKSLKRACTGTTSCTWTFGIFPGSGATTQCSHVVKASGGKPATQVNGGPTTCGKYTVTSGWSDQFGADKAFTTFSVIDYAANKIAWPAYTDAQVKAGKVVSPDQSYPVQAIQ